MVKDGSVTIGINSAGAIPAARLQVVDLGGRIVMEKAMPLVRGYQTIELKAVWGAGQYILKLLHADGLTEAKRIVVQ